MSTDFAPGTLVRARGREWVVLADSDSDFLCLRPLGGTEDEVTGIYLPLEPVESAVFGLPDPEHPGDHRSSRLLREAVRLGFRATTGPFRSFASLGVEPRPYQLVPLLMALKLDPVRLLIADDVGIGKTVEALLVAKELLERGETRGVSVLCPPHLAEQWQREMRSKFHLPAELVLPASVARLERECLLNQSVFERFPITVVSTDYIKSDRRRHDFLRTCPELVIVDEAHTCAGVGAGRGGKARHQRHHLVAELARGNQRHLVLVTATPHSGNEEAFRSLLTLLNPKFADLPQDLSGDANEPHRRRLAEQMVQRRRGDLKDYLDTETPFPQREERECAYRLNAQQRELLNDVLAYARELVTDESGGKLRQRVRWWSALALLRTLSSSPAAAMATLHSRAATLESADEGAVDDLGRRSVLDLGDSEDSEELDLTPGSDWTGPEDKSHLARLRAFAARAEGLRGKNDTKLKTALNLLQELLDEGYRPILFCRFIHTAEYVAEELRKSLKKTEVVAITGLLAPAEREERVESLEKHERRVLVCTDCLSEGINLQKSFNAVIHYDLSWNPTRHEQREGRVDRYGQASPKVRVLTLYGADNPVDGIVLEVLLRKHKTIRNSLGINVPVPSDTHTINEALMQGLLLRGGQTSNEQLTFDFYQEEQQQLHAQWDLASEREKRSQTMFAQRALKVDEVARELAEVRRAQGSSQVVEDFVRGAVRAYGGIAQELNGGYVLHLLGAPEPLRELLGVREGQRVRFELPAGPQEEYLSRTHPLVERLASYVMDSTLDALGDGRARRCGVIRTAAVTVRTTLLLLRLRFFVISRFRESWKSEHRMLAEELQLVAFESSPARARWLSEEAAERLLQAEPSGNVDPNQARQFLRSLLEELPAIETRLETLCRGRAEALLETHRRVRQESGRKGVQYFVEPQLPVDILGVYLYQPA